MKESRNFWIKQKIRFVTALGPNKCLKQVKYDSTRAQSYSELPSNISTMTMMIVLLINITILFNYNEFGLCTHSHPCLFLCLCFLFFCFLYLVTLFFCDFCVYISCSHKKVYKKIWLNGHSLYLTLSLSLLSHSFSVSISLFLSLFLSFLSQPFSSSISFSFCLSLSYGMLTHCFCLKLSHGGGEDGCFDI